MFRNFRVVKLQAEMNTLVIKKPKNNRKSSKDYTKQKNNLKKANSKLKKHSNLLLELASLKNYKISYHPKKINQ